MIKSSMKRCLFFVAFMVIAPVSFGQIITIKDSVSLENFIEGVTHEKRRRFSLHEVIIGDSSVFHMFKVRDKQLLSTWEYYLPQKDTIVFAVISRGDLENMHAIMRAQKADTLEFILLDQHQSTLKWLNENLSFLLPTAYFKEVVKIPLLPSDPPCDEITRIIYSHINTIVEQELEKAAQTATRVNLNDIFDMLLNDEIEPFIASLEPIQQQDECFETFNLLKWVKGDEVPGFEWGEYEINQELKDLFLPIIDALNRMQSNWIKYDLQVKIVGYTDSDPVKEEGIKIDFSQSIAELDSSPTLPRLSEIFYSGCRDDSLISEEPVYFDLFTSTHGARISSPLENNCELGAVRAFMVAIFMKTRLHSEHIAFDYATGGVSTSESNSNLNRKVDIEFVVKAAKRE